MSDSVRSALLLSLVFLCGGMAGGVGEHYWEARVVRAKSSWADSRLHTLEQVKADLALTDEQYQKLGQILDDTMKQFQDLHTRSHEVRQDTKNRILAILDDQQKTRFEASMAKLQKSLGTP